MTHRIRHHLLGLLALTVPLAACAQQPSPSAASAPPPAAQAAPAPQLVGNLPDFTRLVEQVGPGVVNVETTISRRAAAARSGGGMPDDDQMPEFFRRFFGPDGMPGMPGQPRGGRGAPDDDDGAPAGRSMGSGFIISPDGYVLTNHHVVDGASEVKVKLTDRREFTAKVVGSDQQYDVALLKIDGKNLPTVRIGDSNLLKPGQWVVAIGSPFGLDHSVTAGIVSATGRSNPYADQRYVPFIQTDVAINQGNSGGPLLNTRGEVVGINSQIFSASGGYMGISFAIPIDLAMSAVEQIKKTGKVSRGMLGVTMQPNISDVEAKGLGLPDTRGALVNGVQPGTGAAKAGIEPGDFIVAFNGQRINTREDLPPLVGMLPPGSKARVTIVRDGKERDVMVTLSELIADDGMLGQQLPGRAGAAPAPQAAEGTALGISVQEIPAQMRQKLGLEPDQGVQVAQVSSALARKSQLRPGMIVLQVGRVPVSSPAQFHKLTSDAKKGDVVMLLVRAPGSPASQFVAISVE
ncbi:MULTISPECIES: DegQ family serine endoprotease [Xanthomonas]|uniref:DegQ family serine endoprotease n=1 Tax=Xanthomonas TaxID=338 RepID=UPI00186AD91E|nr:MULTISPECIES: DegQ family serine endoprotease [Xanthomonas]MCW0390098.1 Periplasmic pH-dependent serine endoprotease DegQ [Xanthomonas sacchari]MDY4281880.1 DegQ family serine endoprotease [Xanthomonas sp. LF06-19]MDY4338596.1 DegQ family serine endoprotease [Xanthomonas sp. LF07-6]